MHKSVPDDSVLAPFPEPPFEVFYGKEWVVFVQDDVAEGRSLDETDTMLLNAVKRST